MHGSEKGLVRKLKLGDADALDEFVRSYGPRIYNVHCWLCCDPVAAEDLTQETVLAMLEGIIKFRGESRLYTWVYQIARNIALRYLKQRAREGISLDDVRDVESPEHIDELAWGAVLRKHVRDALSLLPVSQREAVVLHCLQGLTQAEVAATLQRPLGTVKWQIAQGLHALRDALLQIGVDPNEL